METWHNETDISICGEKRKLIPEKKCQGSPFLWKRLDAIRWLWMSKSWLTKKRGHRTAYQIIWVQFWQDQIQHLIVLSSTYLHLVVFYFNLLSHHHFNIYIEDCNPFLLQFQYIKLYGIALNKRVYNCLIWLVHEFIMNAHMKILQHTTFSIGCWRAENKLVTYFFFTFCSFLW